MIKPLKIFTFRCIMLLVYYYTLKNNQVKSMAENNLDYYISIDEATEYLDIKTVTLRNWIKKEDNHIPAHKIGKQWKFKRSELDEWVTSGKSAIE